MDAKRTFGNIIEAGDVRGLGIVYTRAGGLISHHGETVLRAVANWDLDVISPWRRILPHVIFPGFHGKASSRLFVSSDRIVLLRDIDEWRELADEMTPLGLPAAAAKDQRLRALKRAGVRQFCQIIPQSLEIVSRRRFIKRGSMIDMKLVGDDGRQYAIMFWKTDGRDVETLDFIESRFRSKSGSIKAD